MEGAPGMGNTLASLFLNTVSSYPKDNFMLFKQKWRLPATIHF